VSARSKARKAAFDVLYSSEQRGQSLSTALAEYESRETAKREPLTEMGFVVLLVNGVSDNIAEIDRIVTENLTDWTLARLFPVDRAILRLATWELLFSETPADAVRAEALSLADEYGSDDAARFIGGVLGAITRAR
jgi:N utilization substance protein B